jgi:hypothetical protein
MKSMRRAKTCPHGSGIILLMFLFEIITYIVAQVWRDECEFCSTCLFFLFGFCFNPAFVNLAGDGERGRRETFWHRNFMLGIDGTAKW